MDYYLHSKDEVLKELGSDENGLSSAEAEKRLEKYGKNKLAEHKKESVFIRFLKQMVDPMILILIGAAIISAVTSAMNGEFPTDVFIIMFVVILNSILGVVQESKAEKAIEALKEMTAATSKVLRDGKITSVHSEDLTVGDVILLEAGDSVPADARLIECASIKAEEAALTGESVPVNKTVDAPPEGHNGEIPLGDRKDMVYMGSTIVYGRGKAVVCDTGMKTEMGKIANALTLAEDEQTPLQIKLAQLSKILTVLVLAVCAFIFAFSIVRTLMNGESLQGKVILDTFMIAISLAVAAIPEGLVAVVTIVLSLGVTRMSKRNAVIRKLTAVETLGCTQVICSDKTGTLTQNKMTVTEYYSDDKELLAKAMSLCSDAELDDNNQAIGEPTECALVNFAFAEGLSKKVLKNQYVRIGEAPFDSMRKMMSTVHDNNGRIIQFTKGAPDEILKRCTSYLSGGTKLPLNDEIRSSILSENKKMADKALRVLAAACKEHFEVPSDYSAEALETGLTFVGLTGMIDPVRPEVKSAIAECREASIRPIMITGDHKDTAVAIAKELGIIKSESEAITGAELNKLSDEELEKNIGKYSVYARVQPEHKVRIVKAWKAKGKVTAMTGDGVNDAPSIKSADIGVGMGITGTDVTKNVADMILADDNFATIILAVEEGRRIYDNIRKAIQFLLSSNLSEVLSIFVASILNFVILKPTHLLWINLITDSLPALALGTEKSEKNIMKRKPRDSKDGIFAGGVAFDMIYQGVLVTILTLAAFFIGHVLDGDANGMTMAFLTMSMAEIFHSMNMRSMRGSIFTMKTHNLFLWGAMIVALVLTTCVIYVPFLSDMFDFAHISFAEYMISLGLAVSVIPIVEIVKLFQRKHTAKKNG